MAPKPLVCPHCGARLEEGETFCPECGADVTIHLKEKPKKTVEPSKVGEPQKGTVAEEFKGGLYLAALFSLVLGNLVLSGLLIAFFSTIFKADVFLYVLVGLTGLLSGGITLSVMQRVTKNTGRQILAGIIAPICILMFIIGAGLIIAALVARRGYMEPGSQAMMVVDMLPKLARGDVLAISWLYYFASNMLFIKAAIRKKQVKALAWYGLAPLVWVVAWILAAKIMIGLTTVTIA